MVGVVVVEKEQEQEEHCQSISGGVKREKERDIQTDRDRQISRRRLFALC